MKLAIAILLLGVGLGLVASEVLFVSMGLLALLAAACIIGAVSTAFAISTDVGVNFLIAVAVGVPTVILATLKVFPHTPFGKRMVASGLSFDATPATDERDVALTGHEGVAETPLRPAGIARLDGRRVDVVSRGELIDSGERVRVLEVNGNRVVVARASEPVSQNSHSPHPSS